MVGCNRDDAEYNKAKEATAVVAVEGKEELDSIKSLLSFMDTSTKTIKATMANNADEMGRGEYEKAIKSAEIVISFLDMDIDFLLDNNKEYSEYEVTRELSYKLMTAYNSYVAGYKMAIASMKEMNIDYLNEFAKHSAEGNKILNEITNETLPKVDARLEELNK